VAVSPRPTSAKPPVEVEDERPSGPSLGVTAGGLRVFAKGATGVYGVALVAISVGVFFRVMPGINDFSTALSRSTEQLDRTTRALAETTHALESVAGDAHEARAGVGRLEERMLGLATKAELEDVRGEVRRACGGPKR
jgi:hypothetical protein